MTTTAYQYPIEALFEAVNTILEDAGAGETAGVIAKFGAKHVTAHDAPPRYVWEPMRLAAERDADARGTVSDPDVTAEHRSLGAVREVVRVGCWGGSFAEARALAHNLLVACDRAAGADVALENARWSQLASSWNQSGELLLVEVSLAVPVMDAIVAFPALETTDPAIFTPTAVEGAIEIVDGLDDVSGDIVLETSTD